MPLWLQGCDYFDKPILLGEKALSLSPYLEKLAKENTQNDIVKLSANHQVTLWIVEYLNRHNGTEPPDSVIPLRHCDLTKVCFHVEDALLMNKVYQQGGSIKPLYELLNASYHLQIKSLWVLCCTKLASLIKGKPTGEALTLLAQYS